MEQAGKLPACDCGWYSVIFYPMAYQRALYGVCHVKPDFSAKDEFWAFAGLIKARRQVLITCLHYYSFFNATISICGGVLVVGGPDFVTQKECDL